jgi:hypothetical protein
MGYLRKNAIPLQDRESRQIVSLGTTFPMLHTETWQDSDGMPRRFTKYGNSVGFI